jgi:hypothetical protein
LFAISLRARYARITYLCPSPIPLLNNLRNRPSFRRSFAREHVLDHHGGRESGGDVEDFEVAGASVSELHDSELHNSELSTTRAVEYTSESKKGGE